ncbi:DUF6172 family protein [Rhodoferax sp. PAMC 29310]|uniref:DUF6172 family protein n=1 Tax=Rhodoferax sp. PAMC 29310 TaxID=2822760 RepID=UPI00351D6206
MTDLRAPMRKTFNLNIEGKNRDRVLEATKHEIRKYVKRQRRVPLPEGVDFWDFDCKFGTSADNAATIHFAELTEKIDAVVQAGGETFYLELLAKDGVRSSKPADMKAAEAAAAAAAAAEDGDDEEDEEEADKA